MVAFFPETRDLSAGWIATPEGTDTMQRAEARAIEGSIGQSTPGNHRAIRSRGARIPGAPTPGTRARSIGKGTVLKNWGGSD